MGLALDELENSGDRVIDSNGMKILLDERIVSYLETVPKLTVDYSETLFGSGFIIEGGSRC